MLQMAWLEMLRWPAKMSAGEEMKAEYTHDARVKGISNRRLARRVMNKK